MAYIVDSNKNKILLSNVLNNSSDIKVEDSLVVEEGPITLKVNGISFNRNSGFSINGISMIKDSFENSNKVFDTIGDKGADANFNYKFSEDGSVSVNFVTSDSYLRAQANNNLLLKNKISSKENDDFSNYYYDIQTLIDEYFWAKLLKEVTVDDETEATKKDVFDYIKNNNLEKEVSDYITAIVSDYSESYLKNQEKIEFLKQNLENDAPNRRYLACKSDEDFQKNVKNDYVLFKIASDYKKMNYTNVRNDKQLSFTHKIDILQADFDKICDDLAWRLEPIKAPGGGKINKSSASGMERKMAAKNNDSLRAVLNDGIITSKDRDDLVVLEEKIFKGSITSDERKRYNEIVAEAENRYKKCLNRIETTYAYFEKIGLNDATMTRKYLVNRSDGKIFKVGEFVKTASKDFKEFKALQSDSLSSSVMFAQKKAMDDFIDKNLEREGEITLLDRKKIAVIQELHHIKNIDNAEMKQKRLNELVNTVLPPLNETIRLSQSCCGIQRTYTNMLQESQKIALFGENYQFANPDKLLERLTELALKNNQNVFNEKVSKLEDFILTDFANNFNNNSSENNGNSEDSEKNEKIIKDIEKLFMPENGKLLFLDNIYDGKPSGDVDVNKIKDYILNSNNVPDLQEFINNGGESILGILKDSLNSSYTEHQDLVKQVVTSTEQSIATEILLDSLNVTVNNKIRDNNKLVVDRLVNDEILGKDNLDGGLGKMIFGDIEASTLLYNDKNSNEIDIRKVLEVRRDLLCILGSVDGKDVKPLKYGLELFNEGQHPSIGDIRNDSSLKEALYDKILALENEFLDYQNDRKEGTKAIDSKTELAGDALRDSLDRNKEFNLAEFVSLTVGGSYKSRVEQFSNERNLVSEDIEKIKEELKDRKKDLDTLNKQLEEKEEEIKNFPLYKDIDNQKDANDLELKQKNVDSIRKQINSIKDDVSEKESKLREKQAEYDKLNSVVGIFSIGEENSFEDERASLNRNLEYTEKAIKEKEIKLLRLLTDDTGDKINLEGFDIKKLEEHLNLSDLSEKEKKDFLKAPKRNVFEFIKDTVNKKEPQEEAENLIEEIRKLENNKNAIEMAIQVVERGDSLENQKIDNATDFLAYKMFASLENGTKDKLSDELKEYRESLRTNESYSNNLLNDSKLSDDLLTKTKEPLNNIRDYLVNVSEGDENKAYGSLNVLFDGIKHLDEKEFIDFTNMSELERQSYIKDLKTNRFLCTAIASTFEKLEKEKGFEKEKFIGLIENFYIERNNLLDDAQGRTFTQSDYENSIDSYLRGESLVPVNIEGSNKLFRTCTDNENTYVISSDSSNTKLPINERTLTSLELSKFIIYLKSPESVTDDNQKEKFDKIIASCCESTEDGYKVSNLKVDLTDDAKESLSQVLKSYGDENSVLISSELAGQVLDSAECIAINANRLYSVDDVVDSISDNLGVASLKKDMEEFVSKHNDLVDNIEISTPYIPLEFDDPLDFVEFLKNYDDAESMKKLNHYLSDNILTEGEIDERKISLEEFVDGIFDKEEEKARTELLTIISDKDGIEPKYKQAADNILKKNNPNYEEEKQEKELEKEAKKFEEMKNSYEKSKAEEKDKNIIKAAKMLLRLTSVDETKEALSEEFGEIDEKKRDDLIQKAIEEINESKKENVNETENEVEKNKGNKKNISESVLE